MSGQSKVMHTVLAAIAAVLMSSVAVGSAVGPAQVGTAHYAAALSA